MVENIKMIKFIWIACVVFPLLVDATYHCEISFPDEHPQGPGHQGQKGEPGETTKPCNCSVLEEKLSKTEDELAKTKDELSDLKQKPRDCYDILYYNPDAISGVYTIYPEHYRPQGITVNCDMDTDGGGWIVFQNRVDGSVDFYRGWKEYLIGFGDLTGEFWLGLEFLHQLTKYGTYDLRVDMTDFEQHKAYAVYSSFKIEEGPGYILKFGDYFGDAGDSMRAPNTHLNQKFTTLDKDQDTHPDNCAVLTEGGYWYGACHDNNLNGRYMGGPYESTIAKGMVWKTWKGDWYSLKSSNMKFRPDYGNYAYDTTITN